MGYKREPMPKAPLAGEALTAALVGIGMLFAAKAAPDSNIEDTLLAASIEGMEGEDLRLLAIMVTWLEVHHPWVNADRLTRLVAAHPGQRVKVFWSAVAHWLSKDRRFARLAKGFQGSRLDLLASGTEFHIRRSGEDTRFKAGPLRVPAGVLRNRKEEVLTPSELASLHGAYRSRILLGPSYRADLWSALDQEPGMSAAELARRAYASFATAWQVKRDWGFLHP
jgi:hypothetical protein